MVDRAGVTAERVKVRLPLDPELGGYESVWASPERDGYMLDNIPLFAFGVSNGDVVDAVVQDGLLTSTRVRRRGGHSTYRVAFPAGASEEDRLAALEPLRTLGCGFERGPSRIVGIDVPPTVDIYTAYSVLQDGMSAGRWTFDEAHCGHPLHGIGRA